MPEFNCGGYKCYLKKLNARANACNPPVPQNGGNLTASSQGVYISSLFCSNACNNGC